MTNRTIHTALVSNVIANGAIVSVDGNEHIVPHATFIGTTDEARNEAFAAVEPGTTELSFVITDEVETCEDGVTRPVASVWGAERLRRRAAAQEVVDRAKAWGGGSVEIIEVHPDRGFVLGKPVGHDFTTLLHFRDTLPADGEAEPTDVRLKDESVFYPGAAVNVELKSAGVDRTNRPSVRVREIAAAA